MAKPRSKKVSKASRSKKKKPSLLQRFTRLPKSALFAITFGLIGVIGLALSSAASTSVSYDVQLKPGSESSSYQVTAATGTLTAVMDGTDQKLALDIFDNNGQSVASASPSKGKNFNPSEKVEAQISVQPGIYTVTVSYKGKLKDTVNTKLSITYPVKDTEAPVDTTPPATIITAPTNSTVSGSIEITASVTDSSGVEKVEFYVDNKLLSTDTTSSYRAAWDTKTVANGPHNISVKSYDKAGNIGTATLTVTVDNQVAPPPPSSTTGIWISQEEIMRLPMSGTAWAQIDSVAKGSLPAPSFSDNTNKHDTSTLALAYHAVRTNSATEKNKVSDEIERGIAGGSTSALDFCRNINSYIIAADIIDLKQIDPTFDTAFRGFLTKWVFGTNTGMRGHTGDGVRGTASESSNNWGTMCRGSYASAAVYMGNQTELDNITKWHKGWLGDRSTYAGFGFREDQSWHADQNSKKGVNSKGATIQGQNVDGVLPEDQRRTGGFEWPAPKGSYPWEAMQGALVADVVLQRAGKITPTFQDSAMLRVYNWLNNVNSNPASGDDEWQPWVINKVYGTRYPTKAGVSEGKIMGWTDWTHQ